jgi:hypothetical protein
LGFKKYLLIRNKSLNKGLYSIFSLFCYLLFRDAFYVGGGGGVDISCILNEGEEEGEGEHPGLEEPDPHQEGQEAQAALHLALPVQHAPAHSTALTEVSICECVCQLMDAGWRRRYEGGN